MSTALWLALSITPPAKPAGIEKVIWCPPVDTLLPFPLQGECLLPPGKAMVPLCHALYAAEYDGSENPLIISTTTTLPTVLPLLPLPDIALAFLREPDNGALFFPSAAMFRQCAREAIRAHNPHKGPLTLLSAWKQVCLMEGYQYYEQ